MTAEAAATDSRIDDLMASAVLAVEGQELVGRDLLAAGIVSGRWQVLEHQLALGIGLVVAQEPPAEEVSEELRTFRLARGLLSGEDMRAWLRVRNLTIGAVKAFAARVVARRHGGVPDSVTPEQVAPELVAEAICSGALQELGWWLADRILSATATDARIDPVALEAPRVQQLVFEEARTVAGAMTADSGLARAERLAWIAALDDTHRAWEATVTAPDEVSRRLREHELDWCRFELDELRLDSEGAAAEASRQLADGADAPQVAAAADAALTVYPMVLADAGPEMARALSGAVVGDVAGPWADGDQHVVARVRERRAPDVDDEQIVERARAELLADAAGRLRAGRVLWHERA